MRILLMTDMEGVAGVKNLEDWCETTSRYYETGCRLLTREVNAAVEGFFSAGAKYIMVADGHGAGGIDIEGLDSRVEYARGWPQGFPFGLEPAFTGIAWVGQHAKASTEYAHLCHTQSFNYIDLSVNGQSIGEFGQLALCAAEMGVPAFFASGDLALTKEAEALTPGIVTCAVKRGVTSGIGEECALKEYQHRNAGAIHTPPVAARTMIRQAAEAAAWKLKNNPPKPVEFKGPYEAVVRWRPEEPGKPRRISRTTHKDSFIGLMNTPMDLKPEV